MPDVFTKDKRSQVMSRIRGKGNHSTELKLLNLFREHRIKGWRRHQPITGKPDFVFPKERLAIFVDGCFWHGCPEHATKPKTNAQYWADKIETNQQRDRQTDQLLRQSGWTVLRFWEHENPETAACAIMKSVQDLKSS